MFSEFSRASGHWEFARGGIWLFLFFSFSCPFNGSRENVVLAGKREWLTRFCSGTCVAWRAGLQLMLITSQFRVGMRSNTNKANCVICTGFFLIWWWWWMGITLSHTHCCNLSHGRQWLWVYGILILQEDLLQGGHGLMVQGYQPVIISLSEGLDIRLNHRCDVARLVHVMHKTRYCIV